MITIDMIDEQIKQTEKPETKQMRTRMPILGLALVANLLGFAYQHHAELLRQAQTGRILKARRNGAHPATGMAANDERRVV
ncbi:MAG: hypothetical protein PHD58_00690 [Anaerolineales bacterium]|nr:hypothetical protein [Anaerolineales bacterium]